MNPGLSHTIFFRDLQAALPVLADATEQEMLRLLQYWMGQRGVSPAVRGEVTDALQFMQSRPQLFSQALARHLRQKLNDAEPAWRDGVSTKSSVYRPSRALSLTLMDDKEVAQNIEQAEIERMLVHAVAMHLPELQALSNRLPGRERADADLDFPISPATVAESVGQAITELTRSTALRVTLLRAASHATPPALVDLYKAQIQVLRISHNARQGAASAFGQTGGRAGSGQVPPVTGAQLEQLLKILARQSQSGPAMQDVWDGLLATVRRQKLVEQQALQQADHPFWRLVDRVAALSSVQSHSEADALELADRLAPVLAALEDTPSPGVDVYEAALLALDEMAKQLLQPAEAAVSKLELEARRRDIEPVVKAQLVEQLQSLELPAVFHQFLLGPWAQVLASALARHGTEAAATERYMNLVAELLDAAARQSRGSALSLREQAPLLSVAQEGMRAIDLPPHQLQGYLDDLIQTLSSRPPAAPAGADALTLNPVTSESDSGVTLAYEYEDEFGNLSTLMLGPDPADVIDSELAQESGIWVEDAEPVVASPVAASAPSAAPTPEPAPLPADSRIDEWTGHAELDTVPMMYGHEAARLRAQQDAWTRDLKVGSMCRLMLQGRWVNALLTWQSDKGLFLMFKSQQGSGTHTLTMRALERMRRDGLATTIESGQMLERAFQTLRIQNQSEP